MDDNLKLVEFKCHTCMIKFGLTREFIDFCKEKDRDFYCPNGHVLIFKESKNMKLEKKISELEAKLLLKKEMKDYSLLPVSGKCPFCDKRYSVLRHHYRVHGYRINYNG